MSDWQFDTRESTTQERYQHNTQILKFIKAVQEKQKNHTNIKRNQSKKESTTITKEVENNLVY
jgi:hypothetical protein